MNIWFTSDTHFHHKNIIEYCNRPFTSVDEMDEALVTNWNARVGVNDTVYHLGDFLLCKSRSRRGFSECLTRMIAKLNGASIFLLPGNHDKVGSGDHPRLCVIPPLVYLPQFGPAGLVLCHYALRVWHKSHYGSWHLYGHSHGFLPENDSASFDIGVDANGYAPVSYDEVEVRMEQKSLHGV